MTPRTDTGSGSNYHRNALDDAIHPPTPEQARRVALHAMTAGSDNAERAELLEALDLRRWLG